MCRDEGGDKDTAGSSNRHQNSSWSSASASGMTKPSYRRDRRDTVMERNDSLKLHYVQNFNVLHTLGNVQLKKNTADLDGEMKCLRF